MAGEYVEFSELTETTSAAANDELLLQQSGGTKRIKKSNFTSDMAKGSDLEAIANKIPSDATSENKLVSTTQLNGSLANLQSNKIDKIISDANYFTSLSNGNYLAIGNNESNSPNDGSGLHEYMTSICNGWFIQTCYSYGTGKIFKRSGYVGIIDKVSWAEILSTNNSNVIESSLNYTGDIGNAKTEIFSLSLNKGKCNISGAFRINNPSKHPLILSMNLNETEKDLGVIYLDDGTHMFSYNGVLNSDQDVKIYLRNYNVTSDTCKITTSHYCNALVIN